MRIVYLQVFFILFFNWQIAHATQFGVGTGYLTKSGKADHDKIQLLLNSEFGKADSPWLQFHLEAPLQTTTAVNPGAAPTSSSPDTKEVTQGQYNALIEFYTSLNWKLWGGNISAGHVSYFSDVSKYKVDSLPHILGLSTSWGNKSYFKIFAGADPINSTPLILFLMPECGYEFKAGGFTALFSGRWRFFQSLTSSTISFNQLGLNILMGYEF